MAVYTFIAEYFFCYLLMSSLIVFANSLGPDQARQNVGPDLVSKCLTMKFLKFFLEKLDFEKKSTDDKE